MKRKAILFGLAGALMLGLLLLAVVIRDARRMARWDVVQSGMQSLALAIEMYRDDHERYPASLEELLSTPEMRNYPELNRVLQNSFRDRFEYAPSPNGFVITVTSPSWFMEPKTIQKEYAKAKALK
jgi:type II secretory pathway pseudopilin PulG